MPEQGELALEISKMRYDVTMPLLEGRVAVEGVRLVPKPMSPMVFADVPAVREGRFGVLDFNMGYLLTAIEAGWELVALPIFPKRKSVLQFIFVRDGIRTPADLEGKRIATRQYRTSVTIWARGLLKEQFGVDIASLSWLAQVPEVFANYDRDARIEMIDPELSLADLLIAGDIDAMATDISDGKLLERLEAAPGVRRLFPDYAAHDLRLHREAGIFPPMHVMVISRRLDRDRPDLAGRLTAAFEAAKTLAYEDIANDRGGLSLVDLRERFAAQRAAWGDAMPYGVAANRRMMDAFIRYNFEQGATKEPMPYERIFAASTLGN